MGPSSKSPNASRLGARKLPGRPALRSGHNNRISTSMCCIAALLDSLQTGGLKSRRAEGLHGTSDSHRHRDRRRPRRDPDRDLQRPGPATTADRRGVRPDRRPVEASPRPHPEPRQRGQGLHGVRTEGPDRRHQRPRGGRGRRCPGPSPASRRRERADRHAALAVRGGRELSRAEGQPERPRAPGAVDDDREPDLVLAPALQRDRARLQHLDPDLPSRADRRHARILEARLLRRRA